jgi:hypothetical protein
MNLLELQYFTSTLVIWTVYCSTIGVIFLVVKVLNARFHHLFDTTESVPEPNKADSSEDASAAADEKQVAAKKPRSVGLNEPYVYFFHTHLSCMLNVFEN